MSILKTVSPEAFALEFQQERLRELEAAVERLKAQKAALEKRTRQMSRHIVIQESSFKGHPMLNFVTANRDGSLPEKLTKWNSKNVSLSKVRLILENLDVARAFVEKHKDASDSEE